MNDDASLRTRFIVTIVFMVTAAVLVISVYFVERHTAQLAEAQASKTAVMREELHQRGMAEARNLGLTAERAVAAMDFAFLSEVISTTLKHDDEILYGAVVDKNGRALVHSDPASVGQTVVSDAERAAGTWQELGAREITMDGDSVLEVQAPIRMVERPWGVIRLGLSEHKLQAEIVQSTRHAKEQVNATITTIVIVVICLLAILGLIGFVLANRIVQPLAELLRGVNAAREGNMGEVHVHGAREFVQLASAFNGMSDAVKQRDETLRQKNRDLEQAVTRAEEASRLKSEFIANISHELRTPLNAIVNAPRAFANEFETNAVWECPECGGLFERVDDDSTDSDAAEAVKDACPNCNVSLALVQKSFFVGDADKCVHFANRQLQAGTHLLALVNDLLDFSRLEAGKMQLHRENVPLAQVMQQVRNLITLAEEKKIQVQLQTPALVVHADPIKLAQILTNLLGNAIKFTPGGGTVTLAAAVEGDAVHFTITDTGIGIPDDKYEVIFESFRQADGSHTRAHQGTGLGLTISRQLVELHSGRIWVESQVGVGSTFHFTIPGAPKALATEAAPSHPTRPSAHDNVLVVDDDRTQLDLARAILERGGLHATLLTDPMQAVATVQNEKPNCVLIDIMLPQLRGLILLRQLKEHPATARVPVLVSTNYQANRSVVEHLGGIWVPKPWNDEVLVQAVRQHAMAWEES